MEQYARKVTTGGNIISRLLTGNIGSKAYAMTMAATDGQDRTKFGKTVTSAFMSGAGMYFLGNIPYQMLLRGSYVRNPDRGFSGMVRKNADANQKYYEDLESRSRR